MGESRLKLEVGWMAGWLCGLMRYYEIMNAKNDADHSNMFQKIITRDIKETQFIEFKAYLKFP